MGPGEGSAGAGAPGNATYTHPRHGGSGAGFAVAVASRRTKRGRLLLYAGSVALVAGAYYAAGRIGLELAY